MSAGDFIVAQLMDMGFDYNAALEAVQRTGSRGVEEATNWLFQHPENVDVTATGACGGGDVSYMDMDMTDNDNAMNDLSGGNAAGGGDAGQPQTKLQVRLPDGKKLNFTFPEKSPLSAVHDAVAPHFDKDHFNLLTALPRNVFLGCDYKKSLKELGLVPSAVLHVMERNMTEAEKAAATRERDAIEAKMVADAQRAEDIAYQRRRAEVAKHADEAKKKKMEEDKEKERIQSLIRDDKARRKNKFNYDNVPGMLDQPQQQQNHPILRHPPNRNGYN